MPKGVAIAKPNISDVESAVKDAIKMATSFDITSQNGDSMSSKEFDLSKIGFENWKITIQLYTDLTLQIINPNGNRMHVNSSKAYIYANSGDGVIRITVCCDDELDSFIMHIDGWRSNPPPEGQGYSSEATGMQILFLAKDKDNKIFGGLGYRSPSSLISESGVMNVSDNNMFLNRSNENDLNTLYLTTMINFTSPDLTLAKSMMMSVTIPKADSDDMSKWGSYYSIAGKKFANLSCAVPSTRCPLIDPWCPY